MTEARNSATAQIAPLFNSAHEALIFAYRYSRQQYPRTPMSHILQGQPHGSGKGLSGLDGAAQAGMILAAVERLPREQELVIRVRYGDVRDTCPCCGQLAPPQEWQEAVDALSHCIELEGVPRQVRREAVERVLCRRKWDAVRLSAEFGLSERTLYRQVGELRKRLGKVENTAMALLDELFAASGVVVDG